MPIAIDLDSLDSLQPRIAGLLGPDALKRMLGDRMLNRPKSFADQQRQDASAHGFALHLEQLHRDVSQSKASRALQLSPGSVFFLDSISALEDYPKNEHWVDLLKKLSNSSQYFSTLFEAQIYASYRDKPFKVHPVGQAQGARTSDFVADCSTSRVFIECKSMEDLSVAEQPLWGTIQSRILKLMARHRRSWRISIRANRWIRGSDVEPMVKAVDQQLRSGLPGEMHYDSMPIYCESYGSYDVERAGDLGVHFDKDALVAVNAEIRRNPDGSMSYRGLVVVEVIRHQGEDESRRILAQIDQSYGQFQDGSPGILHIEIPYKDGARLLDVADRAYQRIFGYLRRKPRINAVVLSARTINTTTTVADRPVLTYYAVVPNPVPRHPLPADFSLLGSQSSAELSEALESETFDLDEGSLSFEFEFFEPLPQQIGRDVLYYSSPDGRRQLRLWQSFANRFRADIVSPVYGRRQAEADLNSLLAHRKHRFAMSWSAEGVSMAVNGAMLTRIGEELR